MKIDNFSKINNQIRLAQLKKEQGKFSEAYFILNEVLKVENNNKKVLNNIGNICKEIGKYEEAIKCYERSINIDEDYEIARINLGIIHHELGNLKKAQKTYLQIIKKNKLNFAICFNLSRINFNFFDKELIDFIKKSLNNKDLSNYNKASGYFILAKNEQKKKNFENEIKFLNKGHDFFYKSFDNKIFEKNLNYWLEIIPSKFKSFKFTNDLNLEPKSTFINPIFIIGMPRSGSTLVESIISSGKTKIPNGGETALVNAAIFKQIKDKIFFKKLNNSDLLIDQKKLCSDIIEKYESLNLLDSKKNYIFTDKSLENFFYIDLLLKIFPNSKFIHCKRNNIDSIFAIYQNFLTKMSWTHSFKNILIYMNNYLKIMKNFEKKFKNRIYTVNLSDLTYQSTKISKEIFKFCGLEWSEKSLEFHKRKDLFSKTASNIQIREKIYEYDKKKYIEYKKYIEDFKNQYEWLKNDM